MHSIIILILNIEFYREIKIKKSKSVHALWNIRGWLTKSRLNTKQLLFIETTAHWWWYNRRDEWRWLVAYHMSIC